MKRMVGWTLAAWLASGCGGDHKLVGVGGSGGGGGGAGAGGAAMDEATREAIQVEEGTYEVEVSLAESQAAIDLGSSDLDQVSLPGGVAAAADATPPKEARSGPTLRPVRFDLGRVLRQLARAPMMPPCTPAPMIEKTPAMTDCRLLGRMGAYSGGVKVTFAACALPSGARIDGTVQTTAKLGLGDGATCDLAGLAAKMAHTLDANLTVTAPDGARSLWSGHATAESRFGRGGTARTTSLDMTRQRFASDGDRLVDQHFAGGTEGRLELSSMPPAWVVSGTQTSELKILGATLTTTETDVRQTLGCCYPTGGSIALHVERGARPAIDRQVVFSAVCGQATVDGAAVDLGACR